MTAIPAIDSLIEEAIIPVCRKYGRWMRRDDLMIASQDWVRRNRDAAHSLYLHGDRKLVRKLRDVAEVAARAQKAAACGYKAGDEVFYSLAALREILPDALDPAATPSGQPGDTPGGRVNKLGYSEWETSLADVRAGVKSLSKDSQGLLLLHYRFGYDPDALGQYYGVSTDAIYSRLARVTRDLQHSLGGRKPSSEQE